MECGSPCCKNSLKIPQMCRNIYFIFSLSISAWFSSAARCAKSQTSAVTLYTSSRCMPNADDSERHFRQANNCTKLQEQHISPCIEFPSRKTPMLRPTTGVSETTQSVAAVYGVTPAFFSLFLRPSDKKTTTTSQI